MLRIGDLKATVAAPGSTRPNDPNYASAVKGWVCRVPKALPPVLKARKP